MQTNFSLAQLADPGANAAEKILRKCVHCGFCTATCPTYALLGDELDSPRGRIYLIKDMLENDRAATGEVVKHIDRCLSCLSCMTTCPSSVDYMHLVDHARRHIEKTYRRPLWDRAFRKILSVVLPRPALFRLAMTAGRLVKPLAGLAPKALRASFDLIPDKLAPASRLDRAQVVASTTPRKRRVALMTGCAQKVLAPEINEATVRLLTRHGCEVVIAAGAGCCGALNHHLGHDGHGYARANILAWTREIESDGLDAIVVNASGCGTTVKDYGVMFRDNAEFAAKAAKIAALARDVTELMSEIGLQRPAQPIGLRVAYHSACSLQHGQKVRVQPKQLLVAEGFVVLDPPEGHLCCGSAGTYNLLQPEIAGRLRERKIAHIEGTAPDVIAAGNIGCLTQIAAGTRVPVAHTAQLLDWATGGPRPTGLAR